MAYPVSAQPARPQMAYPPQSMPAPGPGPAPYDMGRFEQEFAELQRMVADLDGDGIPDIEQGGPAQGGVGGQPARIPVDARSEQDYSDQFGGQPPRPRMPQRPAEAGGVDVAGLGEEAKARIAAGEPREQVIQDLFLRVTRSRANEANPQRMAQAAPQGMGGAAPQTMTDAGPEFPMMGEEEPEEFAPMAPPQPAGPDLRNRLTRSAPQMGRGGILDAFEASPSPDQLSRAGMMPSGSVSSYEPTAGEDAATYLRGQGTIGGRLAPAAQGLIDNAGLPAEMLSSVAMQPVRAGEAVAEAVQDPTLANVTNAGVQTGLAAFRPGGAAAMGALGLAEAARRDLGIGSSSPAEAAPNLTRRQQREMEMERQRAQAQSQAQSDAERSRIEAETAAARQRGMDEAEIESRRQREAAEMERQAAEAAEHDRAVQRSEDAFKREMGRTRRFSDSNSYTKQIMDKVGGLAPFLGGAIGGGVAGAFGRGLGGQALGGMAGGIAATSAPLFEEAYLTDVDNPERAAYMARGAELPPGHPRKQEFLDYGRSLPEDNPVRKEAREQLYSPLRLGLSGAEGAIAGPLLGEPGRALGRAIGGSNRLITPPAGPPPPSAFPSPASENRLLRNAAPEAERRSLTRDANGAYHDEFGRFASPPPKAKKRNKQND